LEQAIDGLPDGDIVRLKASSEFRLRVGDWRVRFAMNRLAKVITVLTVRPRGDAYKKR
jgi:mRNA-degrading endonuclease RelE of RelBE toxin-antitoxin system